MKKRKEKRKKRNILIELEERQSKREKKLRTQS